MEKIFDKAQKEKFNNFYDEHLSDLKEIISQLENGDKNDKNLQEKAMSVLREKIEVIQKELDKSHGCSIGEAWDFSKQKSETVFASGNDIILKPISEAYYDLYLKTREIYVESSEYTNPAYKNIFINEINADSAFFVAVIRKSDDAYLGYAGLKDTTANLWECCIELLPEYCRLGYGYEAVKCFLKKISEITQNEKQQFMALVEVDNIPSQKLMQKLGGKLVDIFDYTFHDEEMAEKFEAEHLDEITDHMTELAEELMVEPRKLLSHVLDYRLFAEKL